MRFFKNKVVTGFNNRPLVAVLSFLLICTALTAIVLGALAGSASGAEDGRIHIPFDSTYPVGMNSEDVAKELERAGFTNLKYMEDYTGWEQSGSVLQVSINNSKKYAKGDPVSPDVTVQIVRSSGDRLDAIPYLADWQTENHDVIAQRLRQAGFTNVTQQEIRTSEQGENQKISRMELNRIAYANGHCFIPKDAPIEIAYYALKICIGNTNEEFIGQDYEQVVQSLEADGFTNVQTKEITDGWGKGNTVTDVSINNLRHYSRDAVFDPAVKITVKYSSNDRIDATACLEHWQDAGYQEVHRGLEEAGFTNITTVYKTTMEQEENETVLSILVGDEVYTGGQCYLPKDTPIEIRYQSLRIVPGKMASSYVDRNYQEVVKELKFKGFTNIILKRANDLITGWLVEEGTIETLSIDGYDGFTETDMFAYDAPIVIVVHTFPLWGCKDITLTAD